MPDTPRHRDSVPEYAHLGGRDVVQTGCRILILLTAATLLLPGEGGCCTTFCFQHEGSWIFGRNLDWSVEGGLIFANPRGLTKTALGQANPASWTARYGSVTFNQYGREFPMGGMNEAGLIVECMWLAGTEYPEPDDRPSVSETQWIQYQLDTSASVEEVIASEKDLRIGTRNSSPLHFLVCDRYGHCIAIEYLRGERVLHRGRDLPLTALTNHTYEEARTFWEQTRGQASDAAFAEANSSLKRFHRAARGVSDYDPESAISPVDYAFSLLGSVAVGRTQWSIVYHVAKETIFFRTQSQPEIRCVDVGLFEFTCDQPVPMLDMVLAGKGNTTGEFVGYTYDANLRMIRRAYRQTDFLREVPDDMLEVLARYPESTVCSSSSDSR